MTDRALLEEARRARERAYAPYSAFPVGAALECMDGSLFTGCNVENATYGATICAEQVAVVKAVSAGRTDFRRIAIVAEGDDYCLPCGTCRQILTEFAPDMEILCAKAGGAYVSYKLRDLLPLAFRLEH